jgi:hypothetical protein
MVDRRAVTTAMTTATAALALTLAGCGGGGSTHPSATATSHAAAGPAPATRAAGAQAPSLPTGPTVQVVQCNGTDSGASLPEVAATTALPAGITVPSGRQVYGTGVKMAWDQASNSSAAVTGPLYLIGRPGMTSVGCYQTPDTPHGGAAMLVQPDNGLDSLGALIVPPGGSQATAACVGDNVSADVCGDAADAGTPTKITTGSDSVTAYVFSLHVTPAAGAFLAGTMPADNTKPVVELVVQNRNPDAGGHAGGFSGVVACSLDDPESCTATLPYFLAQAAAGSPMTAANYAAAFAQITAFVGSGS